MAVTMPEEAHARLQTVGVSDENSSSPNLKEPCHENTSFPRDDLFICTFWHPVGHPRSSMVILRRGMSKKAMVAQLRPMFPGAFRGISIDRVNFRIKIDDQWALVSDSTWDDVMIQGRPDTAEIAITLSGLITDLENLREYFTWNRGLLPLLFFIGFYKLTIGIVLRDCISGLLLKQWRDSDCSSFSYI